MACSDFSSLFLYSNSNLWCSNFACSSTSHSCMSMGFTLLHVTPFSSSSLSRRISFSTKTASRNSDYCFWCHNALQWWSDLPLYIYLVSPLYINLVLHKCLQIKVHGFFSHFLMQLSNIFHQLYNPPTFVVSDRNSTTSVVWKIKYLANKRVTLTSKPKQKGFLKDTNGGAHWKLRKQQEKGPKGHPHGCPLYFLQKRPTKRETHTNLG